ncbi:MAG: GNAT family N-acetyltransferase [Prevotella sp.]|nr:GNAT family N-acetyltransferase [Prevotella sp.]
MGNEVTSFLQELHVKPLEDFHCLNEFHSGVESMDNFIRGDFRLSVENHYCSAYIVKYQEEIVAVFALSFDSLDLDIDDKEYLETGMSGVGTPDIDWNYKDIFYAKPRYPALDIAYLAVQKKWRGRGVGNLLLDTIAEQARSQTFAGCQFLTVEALATKEYSAVGFYTRCGFTPNELRNPNKDTLRMYRTLYEKDEELYDEEI